HRNINQQVLKCITESVADFIITDAGRSDEGICLVCMEAKQSRENLTGKRMKCEQLLHTVHSDMCGPMTVIGHMRERYFATFVDEYSGRIAISLLKQMPEAFERFKQY